MPCIVIAYTTIEINKDLARIYDDSTEKYFENSIDDATKNYIDYLVNKGYTVDSSEIKLYAVGELDIDELKKEDALAKLTPQERALLGV